MVWEGCNAVETVPGILSGVPVVRGSRVQADAVVESAELGESVEDIAYSFTLDPEDIREVLSFAASHTLAKPSA